MADIHEVCTGVTTLPANLAEKNELESWNVGHGIRTSSSKPNKETSGDLSKDFYHYFRSSTEIDQTAVEKVEVSFFSQQNCLLHMCPEFDMQESEVHVQASHGICSRFYKTPYVSNNKSFIGNTT